MDIQFAKSPVTPSKTYSGRMEDIFHDSSRTFLGTGPKQAALDYLGASDDDSLELFGFDLTEKSGSKGFYIASLLTIFNVIFHSFPTLRNDGRNILYEGIENNQKCAFPIDLDLNTSSTGLQPDDNCDSYLLSVVECIQNAFHNLFSIKIGLKNWVITRSPYSFKKSKHSFHLTLVGYVFDNMNDIKIFVKELDAASLGIDLSIYRVGCLRLMGSTKKGQQRPLLPYELTNTEGNRSLMPCDFPSPFDYFKATTVLHNNDGYVPVTIPEQLRVKHKGPAPIISGTVRPRDFVEQSGPVSVYVEVPFALLETAIMALSTNRSDHRDDWCYTIWAIFIVSHHNSYLENGQDLAHRFSQQSTKYERGAVEKLWHTANLKGFNWPSIRNWLRGDNRELWNTLRKDNRYKKFMSTDMSSTYRNQYLPHVEQYRDVVTDVVKYHAPAVTPFDLQANHCVIEHAAMGTSKTARYIELILSGKYRSVLLLVNRQTLCRAAIHRLNYAIRQHMGVYNPHRLFRDYRRPEEVRDPFDIPDDDLDDALALTIPDTSVFLVDSSDEEEESVEDGNHDDHNVHDEPASSPQMKDYLMSAKRLVVQMESCHKIAGRKFDLVIADESESDIYQFSSSTMKRLKDSSSAFFHLLKDAGKLLFLDAFPSDRQFLLLKHLDFPKGTPICYRHNSWRPTGRTAVEIEAPSSQSKKKLMFDAIRHKLKVGKRVVLFTTSLACGKQLVKFIVKEFEDNKKIAFYNKFTDNQVRDRHFDDVDKWWLDVDILIYTPVLLAGVSFNIKNHFHCLFVWAYSESSHVRDMLQAAGRIRHFEIETMFYALDFQNAHSKRSLPLTFDAVKASVDAQGCLIKRYNEHTTQDMPVTHINPLGALLGTLDVCPDMDGPDFTPEHQERIMESMRRVYYARKMENAPAWLLDIHVRNKWEEYLTHNPKSFQTVFEDYLKLAGWEREGCLTEQDVINWENSMRTETGRRRRPKSRLLSPEVSRNYSDIPILKALEYENCRRRQARGTSNQVENLAMERYWFDNHIAVRLGTEEAQEAVFDEMIDDSRKKQIMINLFYEENCTGDELALRTLDRNPFAETTDTLPTILKLLKQLCSELGLRSTHDFEGSFTSTLLEEKLTVLQPIVKDLVDIMHLTESTAQDSIKAFSGQLNKILKNFSGCGITAQRSQTSIEDGSRKNVYRFSFTPEKGNLNISSNFIDNVLAIVVRT